MCLNPWASSSQEISASAAESHRTPHCPRVPAGGWYCIFDPIACFPVCECRAGVWHFPTLASQTPNWSCLLKPKPVGMPHGLVCSPLGTLRYLLLHSPPSSYPLSCVSVRKGSSFISNETSLVRISAVLTHSSLLWYRIHLPWAPCALLNTWMRNFPMDIIWPLAG